MARVNVFFWKVFEYLFRVFAGVKPISSNRELFLIADRRYLGKPFTVDDVQVRRFDRVLEIHINNEFVMDILREQHNLMASSIKLLREARRSLPVLAQYVHDETTDSIEVLYGITFINRGIDRLGFSVMPIENRFFRELSRRHLRKLFQMVNPAANELLATHEDEYIPKVVAMTRKQLLHKYGTQ